MFEEATYCLNDVILWSRNSQEVHLQKIPTGQNAVKIRHLRVLEKILIFDKFSGYEDVKWRSYIFMGWGTPQLCPFPVWQHS